MLVAALGAATILVAQPALAFTSCTTRITDLHARTDGGVYLGLAVRGDYVQVCNVNAVWKTVSPALCQTWYATLLAARYSGSQITIAYSQDMTCTTIPVYEAAPAPFAIQTN